MRLFQQAESLHEMFNILQKFGDVVWVKLPDCLICLRKHIRGGFTPQHGLNSSISLLGVSGNTVVLRLFLRYFFAEIVHLLAELQDPIVLAFDEVLLLKETLLSMGLRLFYSLLMDSSVLPGKLLVMTFFGLTRVEMLDHLVNLFLKFFEEVYEAIGEDLILLVCFTKNLNKRHSFEASALGLGVLLLLRDSCNSRGWD